jgi:hypothetical protein
MLKSNTGLRVSTFDITRYLDLAPDLDQQLIGSSLFAIGASLRSAGGDN